MLRANLSLSDSDRLRLLSTSEMGLPVAPSIWYETRGESWGGKFLETSVEVLGLS